MASKATGIRLNLQSGTNRTVYATWNWSKSHTANYSTRWDYMTANGVWFEGTTSSTTLKSDTYSPPENAVAVRFRVKPISTTRRKNKKETNYWNASWSTFVSYTFAVDNTPDVPSNPSVSLEGYTLKAYVNTYDAKAKTIEFNIVIDNSTLFKTISASVVTNRATVNVPITAGHTYKVQCRAANGNLKSAWSEFSEDYKTAPQGISGPITAIAISETSVKLTWEKTPLGATGYEIEYAEQKDYFGQSGQVNNVTVDTEGTYAIVSNNIASGKENFFRIRATNESGHSPWSDFISVVVGTKPIAPTTWSNTTTALYGENVILYWVHNSEDESKETSAILELTIGDSNPTEIEVPPSTTSDDENVMQYIFDTSPYEVGVSVKWRVKTKGILPQYGDWSIQRSFKVYIQPTVTLGIFRKRNWLWSPFNFTIDDIYNAKAVLSDPYTGDIVVNSFPIYIGASTGPDMQTPLECRFSIFSTEKYEAVDISGEEVWVNPGEEVYSKDMLYDDSLSEYLPSKDFQLTLMPSDISLENNITYRLYCKVVMDTGLTAEDELLFRVEFADEEYDLDAEISYDETLVQTYIQPYAEKDEELYEHVLLSVYRVNLDGTTTLIGQNINNSDRETIVDPHPTLRYVRYRIVATSTDTGRISFYDLPLYPIPETAIVLQWGEKWESFYTQNEDEFVEPVWNGSLLKLPYNVDVSEESNPDVNLVEYIGRSHPVSYYGTQVGQSLKLNSEGVYGDWETIYALRRLSRWLGNVYVRDPNGNGFWANVKVSYSTKHCELTFPVALTATRVEGGV